MNALVRARRVGGDDHALDQLVRVLLHQLAVLERARLGLVGVAARGTCPCRPWAGTTAFLPIEKPAPPRPRRPDALSSSSSSSGVASQRLAQRLVAAAALVDLERFEARLVDVLEQQLVGHEAPRRAFGSTLGAARRAASSGSGSLRPARSCCERASGTSSSVERPDVLAVDRRHRRDVAGAEALEGAHVEVRVVAGRSSRIAREQLVGAAQRARDVRAHVDRVARRPARVSNMS